MLGCRLPPQWQHGSADRLSPGHRVRLPPSPAAPQHRAATFPQGFPCASSRAGCALQARGSRGELQRGRGRQLQARAAVNARWAVAARRHQSAAIITSEQSPSFQQQGRPSAAHLARNTTLNKRGEQSEGISGPVLCRCNVTADASNVQQCNRAHSEHGQAGATPAAPALWPLLPACLSRTPPLSCTVSLRGLSIQFYTTLASSVTTSTSSLALHSCGQPLP